MIEKSAIREVRETFENTVSKILEEDHVINTRIHLRACMKRLMTVDEAKEVCRDRSVPSDYPRDTTRDIVRILKNIFISLLR